MIFRVRGIRPWNAALQVQAQQRDNLANGRIHRIWMEPAMTKHLFM
jgi:hypothetical protein